MSGAMGLLSPGSPPNVAGNAFVTPARMSITTMLDLSRPDDDRLAAAMRSAMPDLPLELQR